MSEIHSNHTAAVRQLFDRFFPCLFSRTSRTPEGQLQCDIVNNPEKPYPSKVYIPSFNGPPDEVELSDKQKKFAEFLLHEFVSPLKKMMEMNEPHSKIRATAFKKIGDLLFHLFKAMEHGFDCEEWTKFTNQGVPGANIMDQGMPRRDSNDKKVTFSVTQDVCIRLWYCFQPSLGGDYVHFFFSHIAAYVAKYGGIGRYSNQSVELNHKTTSRYQERKTRHGGGAIKGACGGQRVEEGADTQVMNLPEEREPLEMRQSKETLSVLLTTKVLKGIRLVHQIRREKPFPKNKREATCETQGA